MRSARGCERCCRTTPPWSTRQSSGSSHDSNASSPSRGSRRWWCLAATGGLDAALPTVRAVLSAGDTSARAAAHLIAEFALAYADELTPLVPDLRDRLEDRWSRLEATRALAQLGVSTAELAEPLVRGIADYAGRFAVATIVELEAVEAVPELEDLIARDERFSQAGIANDIVWADEALRERVHQAIGLLRSSVVITDVLLSHHN